MRRALITVFAFVLASCGGGPGEPADCTTDWDCGCVEDCLDDDRAAIPAQPKPAEAR